MRLHARSRAAGGFSLIELLAVIVILSILITFLMTQLGKGGELVKERACRAQIAMLAGAIGEYESEFGSYPASRFKKEWGAPPNNVNLGAEVLVLSLWGSDWDGSGLPEDNLVNTDGDRSKKSLSSMPTPDLLEIGDPWLNPIAYLTRSDYKREDVYTVEDPETGEPFESRVKAIINKTTGRPYEPHKFQLISAGADGTFGTEDDIANFDTR
jgi:prepilin-type N-terminal cleavage/methylation domain-containing protein